MEHLGGQQQRQVGDIISGVLVAPQHPRDLVARQRVPRRGREPTPLGRRLRWRPVTENVAVVEQLEDRVELLVSLDGDVLHLPVCLVAALPKMIGTVAAQPQPAQVGADGLSGDAGGEQGTGLVVGIAGPRQRQDSMIREDRPEPISSGEDRAPERVAECRVGDPDHLGAMAVGHHQPARRDIVDEIPRRHRSRRGDGGVAADRDRDGELAVPPAGQFNGRRVRRRGHPPNTGSVLLDIDACTDPCGRADTQPASVDGGTGVEVDRRQRRHVGHLGVCRAVEVAGELDDHRIGAGHRIRLGDGATERCAPYRRRATNPQERRADVFHQQPVGTHRRDVAPVGVAKRRHSAELDESEIGISRPDRQPRPVGGERGADRPVADVWWQVVHASS